LFCALFCAMRRLSKFWLNVVRMERSAIRVCRPGFSLRTFRPRVAFAAFIPASAQ
jgi:hypothetical protein